MTDTSVPTDDEAAVPPEEANTPPPEEATTPAPAEPAEPAGTRPVTEHPAYGLVSDLLDALHLQGTEGVIRNALSFFESHAHELASVGEAIAAS